MNENLDSFGLTDVGRKRSHNEDHYLVDDEVGLYIVADGMGGHAAGEVASHKAIEKIGEFVRAVYRDRDFTWPFGIDASLSNEENLVQSAVRLANREICALSEEQADYSGMGTTVVSLLVDGEMGVVAHVGDSRVYRMRGEGFEQLTVDHSWVNEQLARSIITEEEARTHRWRNVITRALGNSTALEVDLVSVDIQPGDIYLLCSDGLNGMVSDEEIQRVLRASSHSSELAAKRLIKRANEAGGLDNVTVLVIRVLGGDLPVWEDKETRITDEDEDDQETLHQ